jgi:APA family basic amino acid/polyamine antiporter
MTLKRGLNLPLLLFYGVGNILGAGIYVLVGEVAQIAGYLAPLAFLVAALIAGVTGITYIELSTRYPVSAGEAVYVEQGFGRRWISVITGLMVSVSGIISSAVLTRGFAGYLELFVTIPEPLVIAVLLGVLCLVAIIGITESVSLAAIFTVLEIGGLLLILWVSRGSFSTIPEHAHELVPKMQIEPWSAIMAGAFLSFFAFIGFEDMVNVAEEVKNPRYTLPRAIVLALVICSLLYGGIALVTVLTVDPASLNSTSAPLAYVYQQATGKDPVFIGLLGLFAIVNGILIQLIMVSRVLYGMASKQWLPDGLATINKRFHTPVNATVITAIVVMVLAMTIPLVSLASATSLVVLLIFALVNAALISVKLKQPPGPDAVQVPMWVPILGLVTTITLVAVSFAAF